MAEQEMRVTTGVKVCYTEMEIIAVPDVKRNVRLKVQA